jgi:hypothetical protein
MSTNQIIKAVNFYQVLSDRDDQALQQTMAEREAIGRSVDLPKAEQKVISAQLLAKRREARAEFIAWLEALSPAEREAEYLYRVADDFAILYGIKQQKKVQAQWNKMARAATQFRRASDDLIASVVDPYDLIAVLDPADYQTFVDVKVAAGKLVDLFTRTTWPWDMGVRRPSRE